jgi:hypothetical protein
MTVTLLNSKRYEIKNENMIIYAVATGGVSTPNFDIASSPSWVCLLRICI